MTGETKIGLITGLSVIVLFAMILSHKGTGQAEILPPPRTASLEMDSDQEESLAVLPIFEPSASPMTPQLNATLETSPINEQQGVTVARGTTAPPDAITRTEPVATPFSTDRFESVSPASAETNAPPVMPGTLRRQIDGTSDRPPAPADGRQKPRSNRELPERRTDFTETFVYVAQTKDTLTKIARKFLGSGSQANVNRIFELNRKELRDPDSLRAGQKILIPAGSVPKSIVSGNRKSGSTEVEIYQVRKGDTLASIARERLGSTKHWHKIFALNKDRYPDADHIPAGAKIKVPVSIHSGIKLARR